MQLFRGSRAWLQCGVVHQSYVLLACRKFWFGAKVIEELDAAVHYMIQLEDVVALCEAAFSIGISIKWMPIDVPDELPARVTPAFMRMMGERVSGAGKEASQSQPAASPLEAWQKLCWAIYSWRQQRQMVTQKASSRHSGLNGTFCSSERVS
eukprot:COSAG01_NODE_2244_length_8081_cov_4.590829_4_plen_152_part_00